MPKPAHIRLSFTGVIGSVGAPVEDWSFSVNLEDDGLADTLDDATIDGRADAARIWYFDQIKPIMGSDVVLTEIRYAYIDGAGLTRRRVDGSYIQGIVQPNLAGDMAPQPMPLQVALCVSLTTGRAGPTGKGRFFLPWPALSLATADRLLPVAQVDGILDNVVAFLNAINGGAGGRVSVVSSKGYTSPVTGVRIGRAPDTMSSRREDAPEGYRTAVLNP